LHWNFDLEKEGTVMPFLENWKNAISKSHSGKVFELMRSVYKTAVQKFMPFLSSTLPKFGRQQEDIH